MEMTKGMEQIVGESATKNSIGAFNTFSPTHSTDQECRIMTTQEPSETHQNQRIFSRIAYEDKVSYIDGNDHQGVAQSVDIGWGGTALSMGRYLRPGTSLNLEFDRPDQQGNRLALQGEVSWCQPTPDKQRFLIGVRAAFNESATLQSLSALMLNAVLNPGQLQPAVATRSATNAERENCTLAYWLKRRKTALEVA